jgi:hypothetical protein
MALMVLAETVNPFITLAWSNFSESQETGAIAPAPENARKKIWAAWSIAPVKKKKKIFFVENNNHFIHFQLQNNAPICPQITTKVKLT